MCYDISGCNKIIQVGLKTASSPTRYLRASNEGVVDLTDSRDASTMWRAYENKDGSLSFQSPFDGFLAVTPGGHVHVTVRDEDRTSTIFRLVPWTGTESMEIYRNHFFEGPLIASRLADIPIRSAIEVSFSALLFTLLQVFSEC